MEPLTLIASDNYKADAIATSETTTIKMTKFGFQENAIEKQSLHYICIYIETYGS